MTTLKFLFHFGLKVIYHLPKPKSERLKTVDIQVLGTELKVVKVVYNLPIYHKKNEQTVMLN